MTNEAMGTLQVSASDLPHGDDVHFPDPALSADLLPSPAEVRQRFFESGGSPNDRFRPQPVHFPEQDLIVKWGLDVSAAEGQCLWFLNKYLHNEVPVPKIYGWKRDGEQTFLYMQLIHGSTLADRWQELTRDEKSVLCKQLSNMINSWRRIQPPRSPVLTPRREAASGLAALVCRIRKTISTLCYGGERPKCDTTNAGKLSQIGGQPLRDIHFYDGGAYPVGPFDDVEQFHKSFANLTIRHPTDSDNALKTNKSLSGLKGKIPVVFTHADLDLSNIMVSGPEDGPIRIKAIIDWHQSGWYPEPWEWLKARCVAHPGADWSENWVETILERPKYEYEYAWEYVSMATI